ncbi:hypothetical protein BDR26DRAFT_1013833 [Obelidium mucronatum]|nr:hypothetical protein BDR26DRAFT_1013833 [Obelidium mucronatum]
MGNTPSQPSQPTTALVFGNTGTGKSRVINLCRYGDEINSDLANKFPAEFAAYMVGPGSEAEDTANESDGVQGAAVSQQAFSRRLLNAILLDSPGFQEGGGEATYTPKDAVIAVFNTIRQAEKGLNVLVYPIVAHRNQIINKPPVTLFYEIMCEKKVPLIIVVTMMDSKMNDATPEELQQPKLLNKWLTEPAVKGHTRTNKESIKFSLFGDDIPENVYVIPFCGKPGPSQVYEQQYAETIRQFQSAIREYSLTAPYQYDTPSTLKKVLKWIWDYFDEERRKMLGDVMELLKTNGFSEEDARKYATDFLKK